MTMKTPTAKLELATFSLIAPVRLMNWQLPYRSSRLGHSQNRIVGGQETGINEFPMMVALADRSISAVKCGGVIIAKRWVMTAAHCLVGQSINNIAVIVGEHDITTG